MASEIRVNKLNSQTGVGTISLSPTGVDISGITTAETLKATTGIVTTLTATTGIVTSFEATTGDITTLRAPTGIVTSLEATTGNITTLRAPTGIVTSFVTNTAKVGAAVTITESGIEASGIGITVANINGGQISGRRNLVINGAMMVAQRGTSTTTSGYLIDRQNVFFQGLDESLTMEQANVSSGTGPYNEGFRKSLKLTNGNQTSGAGSGDRIQPQHKFEAQDIANSGWKYTDPNSFITMSFWVKSSVAQTFYGYLRSKDGTEQRYAYSAALSANTWTKVIKTIPGNSNLQFDSDINEGLQWNILLPFIGTDLTDSGVSLNSWGAYAGGTRTPDNTSTWYTTNDATFELTGLQLEVGTQASSFEHRTFSDEFSLCQRYFQKYACTAQEWIYVEGNGVSYKWWYSHFHPMRSTPTVDVSGLSTGNGTSFAGGSGEISSIAVTSTSQGESNGRVSYRITGSATWGTARQVHHTDSWNTDSVTYNSEL